MKTIPIINCKDVIEANLIKHKLELAGINSFLTNENAATLLPHHFMDSNSGIQIFINGDDAEEAAKIVDSHFENKTALTACPRCNSKNIKLTLGKHKFLKTLKTFFSFFAQTPVQHKFYSYFCKDCKASFEA